MRKGPFPDFHIVCIWASRPPTGSQVREERWDKKQCRMRCDVKMSEAHLWGRSYTSLLLRCCQVGDWRAGLMRGPSLRLQSWVGLESRHTFTAPGQLPSRACPEWLSIAWLTSSKISPTGCPVSESHCHAARVWQLVYRFSGGGECETLGCPCSESSSGWEWHPVWIFSLLIASVLSLWPCPWATPTHTLSYKRALDVR